MVSKVFSFLNYVIMKGQQRLVKLATPQINEKGTYQDQWTVGSPGLWKFTLQHTGTTTAVISDIQPNSESLVSLTRSDTNSTCQISQNLYPSVPYTGSEDNSDAPTTSVHQNGSVFQALKLPGRPQAETAQCNTFQNGFTEYRTWPLWVLNIGAS